MISSLKAYPVYIKTIMQLGIRNVLMVLIYRLLIKSRLLELLLPVGKAYKGKIFPKQKNSELISSYHFDESKVLDDADKLVDQHKICYFSNQFVHVGSPPVWFYNPFNGQCMQKTTRHFSRIPDFNYDLGDIKAIWEASRFDWAPALARAFRLTGNPKYLDVLNLWTEDWIHHNPYSVGPNWKCGQETAIRMLNILLAAHILEQDTSPSDVLTRFVSEHCLRIKPTLFYAAAQENNHATSEAAGLFVGGAWLAKFARRNPALASNAVKWCNVGRRHLEESIQRLVEKDGSFSQKSLNYHRVLMDTLSLAECWRRQCMQEPFSDLFYKKARKAVEWLYHMVDEESGDGPNLGANDGARLLQLSAAPYRDYRSSVQLGCALFLNGKCYPDGIWDETLFWFNFRSRINSQVIFKRESKQFDDGGYVILRGNSNSKNISWGMVRYPRFKTRPAHADVFHFDLWHKGENILRDGGTYSYAAPVLQMSYFKGTPSHNTIQFDERDQMPTLGRFLFGDWINPFTVGNLVQSAKCQSWSGSYLDRHGSFHKRTVSLHENVWEIDDEIGGYKKTAVLRWRLCPGEWHIEGTCCRSKYVVIDITSSVRINSFKLVEGLESRHYFEVNQIPVLEVEVSLADVMLKTCIYFEGE